MIGDLRTVALVDRRGEVTWLCLPDIDDDPVFASLLDRLNGGCLIAAPADEIETVRRYRGGTAILETEFRTAGGRLRLTDFLHLFPDGERGQVQPERELIRIAEVLEGEVDLNVTYRPRPGFGSHVPDLRERGKLGWTFAHGADFFLLRSDVPLEKVERGLVAGTETLRAGAKRMLSLSFCRRDVGVVPMLGRECEAKLAASEDWWRRWAGKCCYDGPFAEPVLRSLIILRQLSFSQSGAVVAAPTTSLPEMVGGSRNWDYRYCWLRDAWFVLASFMRLGYRAEAQVYFDWLMHATQITAPELNILYDVYGRADLDEREVETLEGYRRSAPVRTGNAAQQQLQLDVYGAVILAAVEFVEQGGGFGRFEARRLRGFGEVVRRQWTRPDNGIWEMRGRRVHHSFSKTMCYAALDGLLRLEGKGMVPCDRQALAAERDSIRRTVEEQAWNEKRGAFTGAFGADWLDASLLLMPKLGFLSTDDPRMVATFERIEEELAEGPFVRRYAAGVDGLAGGEGAFLACSFWAVEYLAMRGDVEAARERMSVLVDSANDLGLLAEEYDVGSKQLVGNFPQAFSHTALISAALAIERAERKVGP